MGDLIGRRRLADAAARSGLPGPIPALLLGVVLLVVTAACGEPALGEAAPTTTSEAPGQGAILGPIDLAAATQRVADLDTPPRPEGLIDDVPVIEVTVAGEVWRVAVAATPQARAQGLMHVSDFGDLDGMLFVWPGDVEVAFWMKDTVMPLEIAFFDADGELVDRFTMEPCIADPCDTYPAAGPFRFALEYPPGRWPGAP